MRFIRLTITAVLISLFLSAPASAQRYDRQQGWEFLGNKRVGIFRLDKDIIMVNKAIGRFDAISLKVLASDVYVARISVIFGNGKKQDIAVRTLVSNDDRPINIDLQGGARFIDRIELFYRGMPSLKGLPEVEVYGHLVGARGRRSPDVSYKRPPSPPAGWIVAGERTINFNTDRAVIELGRDLGRFDAVRFLVVRNPIRLRSVNVRYGNGRRHLTRTGERLRIGEVSQIVDLKGRRFIDEIEITYNARNKRARRANVIVWARLAGGRHERQDYSEGGYRDEQLMFRNADLWVPAFGQASGGWSMQHKRVLADVNGDGRKDVVGFADKGVYVSINRRGKFGQPKLWVSAFGRSAGGWTNTQNIRTVADVNGDGKADVVGFGSKGVFVSLSRGNRFGQPELWVKAYGRGNGGWTVGKHLRTVVDVNGDGRADIVGFADQGVYVSLSRRRHFSEPKLWTSGFSLTNGGWKYSEHPRHVIDINGDGRADLVGFGSKGVIVALNKGRRFGSSKSWLNSFGARQGWAAKHLRHLSDVNGDGRPDIVGFADKGVYVALNRRNRFEASKLWVAGFGSSTGGWRYPTHVRTLADVNGDGRADVVGFSDAGTFVALSNGRKFSRPKLAVKSYGNALGWNVRSHLRIVTDVNGDRNADIVGFADKGVYVAISKN